MSNTMSLSWEWDRQEELRRDQRDEEHPKCGFRWGLGTPEEAAKYYNEHCAHCSYMSEACMYGE